MLVCFLPLLPLLPVAVPSSNSAVAQTPQNFQPGTMPRDEDLWLGNVHIGGPIGIIGSHCGASLCGEYQVSDRYQQHMIITYFNITI